MNGLAVELLLVAVLIVLNAIFSGSEIALLSLRDGQVRRLETDGRRGAVLSRLVGDPNRYLATIQIGITLAGFLASATAAVSIAEVLATPLAFLGEAARPTAILVVTLVLAYLTLVLGELAPKRLAMQRAEVWSLAVARPLEALARLARPAVWFLSASTDAVVRVFGADPSHRGDAMQDEELRELVQGAAWFTPYQRRIIAGAFEIADRRLREVLRPRPAVVTLDADASCAVGAAQLIGAGHSRAPVVNGDLDHVVGVVALADLVGQPGTVSERAREVRHLPTSATVLDALHELQAAHEQLAIVLNEYGGAEGIVTIEDLLEEIVGELYDGVDLDVGAIRRDPDGSVVLAGSVAIHDLAELGFDLPAGPYATVAGLVLTELGHIPRAPGERVSVGRWQLTVTRVERRAITEVRLVSRTPAGSPRREDVKS